MASEIPPDTTAEMSAVISALPVQPGSFRPRPDNRRLSHENFRREPGGYVHDGAKVIPLLEAYASASRSPPTAVPDLSSCLRWSELTLVRFGSLMSGKAQGREIMGGNAE